MKNVYLDKFIGTVTDRVAAYPANVEVYRITSIR